MKSSFFSKLGAFSTRKPARNEKVFHLQVVVSRDIALLTKRNLKKVLAGALHLVHSPSQNMNRHAPDKEPISLMIPRRLKVRLVREARQKGIPLAEHVTKILAAEVADFPLSSKDYEAIRIATEKAEKTKRRIATIIDD